MGREPPRGSVAGARQRTETQRLYHKGSDYYTLGRWRELGHGLSPEGEALLRKAAKDSGVELLTAVDPGRDDQTEIGAIESFEPRVFISIGGSQANLGESQTC